MKNKFSKCKSFFIKYKNFFICIILIGGVVSIIVLLISLFPRPIKKQSLQIGDKVQGYRIMNHCCSYSYVTSIEESDSVYKIKFLQYYNNDPYEFCYYINEESCIDMFYSKIPSNKRIKVKVFIGEDKRSLILERIEQD